MLRIFLYAVSALLVCAGVSVVFLNYGTSAYDLLILPLLILARRMMVRVLAVIAEAFVRWGWNRTLAFLFFVTLPRLWRRSLTRGATRLEAYLKARWLVCKSHWSDWPKYAQRVIAAMVFLFLCLAVVHAEEITVVIALAFVRIPLLSPAMKWVRVATVRLIARVGVVVSLGLFLKRLSGTGFIANAQALYQEWMRRERLWRLGFTRKVFKQKKNLRRETTRLSRRFKKDGGLPPP
ncbi:MAG: hypothetical protein PHV99_00435 [Candidatus Pacebacteria bacterium]|nr:hypothetical protein [Candidatus Paceibacterota bacterium]